MLRPEYKNEPNINLGSRNFQCLIDPSNNDYPDEYSDDEEEKKQNDQDQQETEEVVKAKLEKKKKKCELWCLGMLQHIVGHIVGRKHQFPAQLVEAKLDEKGLLNAKLAQFEREREQLVRQTQHVDKRELAQQTVQVEILDAQAKMAEEKKQEELKKAEEEKQKEESRRNRAEQNQA